MDDHSSFADHHGRANIALFGFLLVGGFYLLTEHRAHLFGILPYLIFLACPLMHLFMHHGHDNGGADRSSNTGPSAGPPPPPNREMPS